MNIEQLTKSQIILLTLLVSFVTSIATGIVTVTLLAQAPPAVTQTINRVVERTVERVVPGEGEEKIVTKETTVVVKENDLITESIEKNAKNIVRVFRKATGAGDDQSDTLVTLGVVISNGGLVATDASAIVTGFSYEVVTADNKTFKARILEKETGLPTAILAITAVEEGATFSSASLFSKENKLKLGQTVIAIGGGERTSVTTGIISGLIALETQGETGSEENANLLSAIVVDMNKDNVLLGSPLVDIFGEVVGISTFSSQQVGSDTYTPISVVAEQLSRLEALTNE